MFYSMPAKLGIRHLLKNTDRNTALSIYNTLRTSRIKEIVIEIIVNPNNGLEGTDKAFS